MNDGRPMFGEERKLLSPSIMTDHRTASQPDSKPDPSTAPVAGVDRHDLSIKGTPAEWFEAEQESPLDWAVAGGRHQRTPTVSHMRRKVDGGTLVMSGILAFVLASVLWTTAELLGLYGSPWLAVPAAILIALVIRAGCGRQDPDGRATAAAITYLISFLAVMVLLTRQEIHQVYGNIDDVQLLEENLFRRRFNQLDQLAAYVIGWAVSWYASMWLDS